MIPWKNGNTLFMTCLVLILFQALTGCGKKNKYNPFDPNDPDYQKPAVLDLSLSVNDTLFTDTCSITWAGNNKECLFRYKFQAAGPWSAWSTVSSCKEILADGSYQFEVSVKYPGKNTDTTITVRPFRVMTLIGPAVYLYPQKTIVSDTQPAASYTVKSLGMDSCNALDIVFSGATVHSAELLAIPAAVPRTVFVYDTRVTIMLLDSSESAYIHGDMSFLSVRLVPSAAGDTSWITMSVVNAERVGIGRDTVHVGETKGGFIIKQ